MWLRILQLKVIEEKLNSQLIALFRTNLILVIIIWNYSRFMLQYGTNEYCMEDTELPGVIWWQFGGNAERELVI